MFSLKRNKSPGVDTIRINDLCRNFRHVQHVLLTMINEFLVPDVIPIELKTALVKPVSKGGSANKPECYRPISILPCIGEILEKYLYLVLSSFIET